MVCRLWKQHIHPRVAAWPNLARLLWLGLSSTSFAMSHAVLPATSQFSTAIVLHGETCSHWVPTLGLSKNCGPRIHSPGLTLLLKWSAASQISHPANTFDSLGCAETAPQHHPSKLSVQKFRATLQRKAPPIAPCRVTSPSGALGFHFELPRHTLTLLPHDDTVFSAWAYRWSMGISGSDSLEVRIPYKAYI